MPPDPPDTQLLLTLRYDWLNSMLLCIIPSVSYTLYFADTHVLLTCFAANTHVLLTRFAASIHVILTRLMLTCV